MRDIYNALQSKTELLNPSLSLSLDYYIYRYTHVLSYLFYDAIIPTIASGCVYRL